MATTMDGVDDVLLAEAGRVLGTMGAAETVNRALATVVTDRRRQAAVEAEIRRFASGHYAVVHGARGHA